MAVSGLGGKLLAHSTLRDRNLIPVAARKITIKTKLKKRANLANLLTISRLTWQEHPVQHQNFRIF
jgi:hypothetical protein